MRLLIKNGNIVNEGRIFRGSILIENDRIAQIFENGKSGTSVSGIDEVYDATGKMIFPGFIDTHVHFREPGLTHKADIYTESRAAAAGGVTSYFEMPNTKPATTTNELIDEKLNIAKKNSLVNYSFFVGATNDNISEILKMDFNKICGIKVFMGSSTGNMLVDSEESLKLLFKESPVTIAAHCESESIIRQDTEKFKQMFGNDADPKIHEHVRSAKACYESTSLAVAIAKEYQTRLHVAHISTKRELSLFEDKPLTDKKITAEVCIPHLWFDSDDYENFGIRIKCNPSIKGRGDRNALRKALSTNIIDSVATDHAPHTWEEKNKPYFEAPSGMPSVEFSAAIMNELCRRDIITPQIMAQKMCHAPAMIFDIKDRGFLREGYYADIAIFDPFKSYEVMDSKVYSKCKWSPFNELKFKGKVCSTIVNGKFVYKNFSIMETEAAKQIEFNRK